MTNIRSVPKIIDMLGGNDAVAALTSSTPKAVSNWRYIGKFPASTYLVLKSELLRCGHSAPDHLWSMKPVPRADSRCTA